MKKVFTLLLILALLGSVLFAVSCGKEPAEVKYTVTWVVGENTKTTTVPAGETPVYPDGIPAKENTQTEAYKFTGWDKELVPVTADVTYTAKFDSATPVETRWQVQSGMIISYTYPGEIPVFPGNPSCDEVDYHYIFRNWNKEIVPTTPGKTDFYRAEYTKELVQYHAKFIVNGEVAAETDADYGTLARYTGKTPAKTGMVFAGWDPPLVGITEDTTYTAVFGKADANGNYINLTPENIASALKEGLVAYTLENGQKTGPYNAMTSSAYLLMQEHYNPGAKTIQDYVIRQLESLVKGGNEPSMDSGPMWSFAQCAAAVALAKDTPSVWNRLSAEVQGKLDLLMRCFVITDNFGMNDKNNYTTTLALAGNYNKGWNPNYRFTSLMPMLYGASFFGGADAVDAILTGFSYDAYIEELTKAGFTNILTIWQTAGKDLMENGGSVTSSDGKTSSGVGCKEPFKYQGYRLDAEGIPAIFNFMMEFNYSGGPVRSSLPYGAAEPQAYIPGGKISPVEGKLGLLLEFNGGDAGGLRSSLGYSQADFILGITGFGTLMTLGSFNPKTDLPQTVANKIWVGNADFIFKCTTGYHDFEKGSGKDVTVGGYGGLPYIRDLWESNLVKVCKYDEKVGYGITYKVGDETYEETLETAAATINSSYLENGYVWYDADGRQRYYPGGCEIDLTEIGHLTLTAVRGTSDIDPGTFCLADKKDIRVVANLGSDAFNTFSSNGSGYYLLEMTFSVPADAPLGAFSVQYKHIDGPNPATGLISCDVNGNVIADDGTAIGTLTAENPITVAVSYNTTTGKIIVWVLTDEGYEPVTGFNRANDLGTVGRPFYIRCPEKAEKGVVVSYLCYQGAHAPMSAPVVGSAEYYDYTIKYTVNGETYTQGSNEDTMTLDASEYLPAGYLWTDGSKYYAGGSSFTFLFKGKLNLTAIPGTNVIAPEGGTVFAAQTHSDLSTDGSGDGTVQASCAVMEAMISLDITVSIPETGAFPEGFAIQYKHLNAPNPATWIMKIKKDSETGEYYYAACDAGETGICDAVAGKSERFVIAYNTVTGENAIWHYEDGEFVLRASFVVENTNGTVGRFKYFYLPRSAAGSSIGLDYTYYLGVYGPIGAPVVNH